MHSDIQFLRQLRMRGISLFGLLVCYLTLSISDSGTDRTGKFLGISGASSQGTFWLCYPIGISVMCGLEGTPEEILFWGLSVGNGSGGRGVVVGFRRIRLHFFYPAHSTTRLGRPIIAIGDARSVEIRRVNKMGAFECYHHGVTGSGATTFNLVAHIGGTSSFAYIVYASGSGLVPLPIGYGMMSIRLGKGIASLEVGDLEQEGSFGLGLGKQSTLVGQLKTELWEFLMRALQMGSMNRK